MNSFTIKDIENLSGIKAHTWRIWEQRYGIGLPQRKDSNHRYYNNENLKEILRISYLYHSGLKISKIVSLGIDKMNELLLRSNENKNNYYLNLIEAAIDLNEVKFDRVLTNAFISLSAEDVVEYVIYPFTEKIGRLWLTDHVIPSQEHFTSNIIRQKLANAIEQLPMPYLYELTVLVFSPEKEYHEIPLQYVYYLLRKKNIRVIYFGDNTSLQTLLHYSTACPFDIIYFHLITQLHTDAGEYLKQLSQFFPEKKIIMSGPQTAAVKSASENVQIAGSLQEFKNIFAI